ncbi:hypothetical protein TA3x_003778 [Tundrisphaera sp. TA3]|uniref:hypothetical protein n=1 Tax=Tundrisphaera sp. TA3 TaxID=3435775 RepID=UPI003EBAD8A9
MTDRKARDRVQLSLIVVLALNVVGLLFSPALIPAYQAGSVDAILGPDELRDRKLIEVVYRTHRHNETSPTRIILPFQFLGAVTALTAAAGLVALLRVPKPLAPGMMGMRDRPSS